MLVGALWGCTNPLLREGTSTAEKESGIQENKSNTERALIKWIASSLRMFLNVRVWLPYLLNQSGSVLFYYTLANSDLSLAVPICNGLSLVFSIVTSYLVGERIINPVRTTLGAALIMAGVAICLSSQEEEEVSSQNKEL